MKTKTYTWRNYIEYIKDNPEGYWFKRRLYGWGWFPAKIQGWFVVAIALAVIFGGVYIGEIDDAPGAYLLGIALAIALLIGVSYWKGEKPGWTWGAITHRHRGE